MMNISTKKFLFIVVPLAIGLLVAFLYSVSLQKEVEVLRGEIETVKNNISENTADAEVDREEGNGNNPETEYYDDEPSPEVSKRIDDAIEKINALDEELDHLQEEAMDYGNESDIPKELRTRMEEISAEIDRLYEEEIESQSF